MNLNYEIKELEKTIKIKQRLGKNYRMESALLEAYKEYQEVNPDKNLDRDLLYNHTEKPQNQK